MFGTCGAGGGRGKLYTVGAHCTLDLGGQTGLRSAAHKTSQSYLIFPFDTSQTLLYSGNIRVATNAKRLRARDNKMKITLTNNFHGTSVEIVTRKTNTTRISESQRRKAKAALCGISGCTCSGPFGTRGHQEFDVQQIWGKNPSGYDGGFVVMGRGE